MDIDRVPICPVCGEECETIKRQEGEIIGCENCVTDEDAWQWLWDEINGEEQIKADMAYEAARERACGIL